MNLDIGNNMLHKSALLNVFDLNNFTLKEFYSCIGLIFNVNIYTKAD